MIALHVAGQADLPSAGFAAMAVISYGSTLPNNQRWSPQQISQHLRHKFPGQPEMWLCHEGIY